MLKSFIAKIIKYLSICFILIFSLNSCTDSNFLQTNIVQPISFNMNLSALRSEFSDGDSMEVIMIMMSSSISDETYSKMQNLVSQTNPDFSVLQNDSSCLCFQKENINSINTSVSFTTPTMFIATQFLILAAVIHNGELIGYTISPNSRSSWHTPLSPSIKLTIKVDAGQIWLYENKNDYSYEINVYRDSSFTNPKQVESSYELSDSYFDGTFGKDFYVIDGSTSAGIIKIDSKGNSSIIAEKNPDDYYIDRFRFDANGKLYCLLNDRSDNIYIASMENNVENIYGCIYGSSDVFCVDNDESFFYMYNDSSGDYITKYSFSASTTTAASVELTDTLVPGLGTALADSNSPRCEFTDILYLDGRVYVLISYSPCNPYNMITEWTENTNHYSKGVMLVLDADTLSLIGYYGWTESARANLDPSGDSQKFYGPVKFLAVRSGKIYIADDGATLVEGSNDTAEIVQKNRVMIFDTKSSSLSAVDTTVKFNETITVSGLTNSAVSE